jgi:hypothetical protein
MSTTLSLLIAVVEEFDAAPRHPLSHSTRVGCTGLGRHYSLDDSRRAEALALEVNLPVELGGASARDVEHLGTE